MSQTWEGRIELFLCHLHSQIKLCTLNLLLLILGLLWVGVIVMLGIIGGVLRKEQVLLSGGRLHN